MAVQLVSGQTVGTLFDMEESKYMQERMELEAAADRQGQGLSSCASPCSALPPPCPALPCPALVSAFFHSVSVLYLSYVQALCPALVWPLSAPAGLLHALLPHFTVWDAHLSWLDLPAQACSLPGMLLHLESESKS